MVKNFFNSSVRVVGDAPLIDVPFMMVMLSAFEFENNNGEDGFSSAAKVSTGARL